MRNLVIALVILTSCPGIAILAQEKEPRTSETPPPRTQVPHPIKVKLDFNPVDATITPAVAPFTADLAFPIDWTIGPVATDFTTPPQEAPAKPRRRIGIKMGSVEAPLATHLGVEAEAVVLILEVISGSAAETAGLQRYDVITHIDGEAPVTTAALIAAVQGHDAGETLDLRILRRARAMEISVKIPPLPMIAKADASGRFTLKGLVPRPYYVTTTAKKEGTYLYVIPQVSHRYVTDMTWAQPMDPQKLLERLAKMEKRLARMEKLLEEARER